ncbi:MAG TPA: leucyl/phenylalanyl-tRNA--protein transferase [Propionibacteriaceae bacterium]|nr:leucyl/phenylalanyl-tRNA--protein transferase [Propionibacteriaceae bacterium]
MLLQIFGPEATWPDQDLVAFSTEFSADLAFAGYCAGVFPMPLHEDNFGGDFGGEMGWWSPIHRGILPLDALRVTRSLAQATRRYTTTVDAAFGEVLDHCGDPARESGWIDDEVKAVYTELYERGCVHSIETWDASGRLVGGLYGVSIGGLFAGESMFHDPTFGRDASKVALVRLVDILRSSGDDRLLDVQWRTDHLASLGVREISRRAYLRDLERALDATPTVWPSAATSLRGAHA